MEYALHLSPHIEFPLPLWKPNLFKDQFPFSTASKQEPIQCPVMRTLQTRK